MLKPGYSCGKAKWLRRNSIIKMFKDGNTRLAGKTDSIAMVESFKTFDFFTCTPFWRTNKAKQKFNVICIKLIKRTLLKTLKRQLIGDFSLIGCLSNGGMHKSAFGSFFQFYVSAMKENSKWSLIKLPDGKQDWGIDWVMRRTGYWFKIITWQTKTVPTIHIWRNSQMWWHVGVVPKWFW